MMKSITAAELSNLVASGKHIDLIDVRTPIEFRSMHVSVARNEPLDRLDPKAIQSSRNGTFADPLYVVCRSGSRGRQACDKLLNSGISNVINIEGGTIACEAAGLPMVRGKKAIPLNCQVQIITGLTVIAGGLLTLLTSNLWWLALPIGMGAGLVFSGITNTCAMGTFLARMPWNQVPSNAVPLTATTASQACSDPGARCCN